MSRISNIEELNHSAFIQAMLLGLKNVERLCVGYSTISAFEESDTGAATILENPSNIAFKEVQYPYL